MEKNLIIKLVGLNIQIIRVSKNISIEDLANQIQVSVQQVHNIEKGTVDLNLDLLYSISKKLGVEVHELFV